MFINKILFLSDAASIHTRRWAEYFRDKGIEVHIASFRLNLIPGVSVHVLPSYGMDKVGYLLAIPTIRSLARRIVPDLIHAQYVTSYGFLAAVAGLRPLIVTAWGTDVLISPKTSRVKRFLARYAVYHASAVTTVAEHMNASVVALGIPDEKVNAIPFGVNLQTFVPSPSDFENRTHIRLICTRNFGPIYDVKTLILALAKLFSHGRRLEVHLVGEGPLRQSLIDLVSQLGLEQHVRFHGHVDLKVLVGLLAGADIFVTPALSDGNNVSLNEAMACGCFPIATDIPANTQWIVHGKNGYLYPSGDDERLALAIERAMDDHVLRANAKKVNRKIVENRADWHICVKRMEMIYMRVSGKRFDES